jgi:hypothetical protein
MKTKKLKSFPTAQFLAWLVTQGERQFQYTDSGQCAVASFAKEVLKLKCVNVGPYVLESSQGSVSIPDAVERALCHDIPTDEFTASEAVRAFRTRLTEFPTELFLEWLDWQDRRTFNFFNNHKCFAASFVKEVLGHAEGATCSGVCVGIFGDQRFNLPAEVAEGLNVTADIRNPLKRSRASTAAKNIRARL